MVLTDSPAFAVGMMLAGLAAGMTWYGFRLKKHQMPVRTALLAAVLGSMLALVCAKAGYLLHDLGNTLFEGYFDDVFSLKAETLSFAGGCAGFAAGVILAGRMDGIRPMKALDLFTVPGCVMICLARIAEGGLGSIGLGNAVEDGWIRFFPLTMEDSWGDAYLSVFVLEALTALVCLAAALRFRKNPDNREGILFEKTAVCLIGAQIGWEMLLQYPYARTFLISFISLEQVLWAVILLIVEIRRSRKNGSACPAVRTVLLYGLSAFFQFFRDKPYLFTRYLPEAAEAWLQERMDAVSLIVFVLISACLILAGLRGAARPERTRILTEK